MNLANYVNSIMRLRRNESTLNQFQIKIKSKQKDAILYDQQKMTEHLLCKRTSLFFKEDQPVGY